FSSRRRHTRSKRDWSSDVCSSDLGSQDHFDLWVESWQFNALFFVVPFSTWVQWNIPNTKQSFIDINELSSLYGNVVSIFAGCLSNLVSNVFAALICCGNDGRTRRNWLDLLIWGSICVRSTVVDGFTGR